MKPNSHLPDSADETLHMMMFYLDGELPADDVRELNHRLRANPELRKTFSALLLLQTSLRQIGPGTIPPAEAPSPAAVDSPDTVAISKASWLRALWNCVGWRWATLAAALVICLMAWPLSRSEADVILTEMEGTVTLHRNSGASRPVLNSSLRLNDNIQLGPAASATLHFARGADIRISQEALVRYEKTANGPRIRLKRGLLDAEVSPQSKTDPLQILTDMAQVQVLGTQFALWASTRATLLNVRKGSVRLTRFEDGAQATATEGQQITAAPRLPLRTGSLQGGVLREVWRNLPGSRVNDLVVSPAFPERPTVSDRQLTLQLTTRLGDAYGMRLRGWLHPLVSGEYQFWIAADDSAELWLSSNEDPAAKRRMCFNASYVGPQLRDKLPEQTSQPILLHAGRRYYIEVLMKQAGGDEGLAVAWSGPGIDRSFIPETCLSPWTAEIPNGAPEASIP